MSRVVYKNHIASMHGKVEPGANQSFRGNFTYTLQNPRTAESFSEHEKQYHKKFGELNKQASQINKDPARVNEYTDWQEKGYKSRFRYILAELVKNNPVSE